ncbi:hypothetical protein, partial [Actinokineospora auranticolor]|uniref:hypothetical protein n=1 Tax=Actinokineospora auranticolor TaxID=155976 RepID=UPI001CA4FF50
MVGVGNAPGFVLGDGAFDHDTGAVVVSVELPFPVGSLPVSGSSDRGQDSAADAALVAEPGAGIPSLENVRDLQADDVVPRSRHRIRHPPHTPAQQQ